MPTFVTRIRVPAAIADAVATPFVRQMLEHPTDGEILEQEGDAEAGAVRIAFEADDLRDAETHARLLTERAPGTEVQDVVQAP
ncbi:hypothetical protein J4G33_12570 [Actinotalea sp. BY-33]|uniref:Uncharacterized protein n=1 Tax=Actinotalea soli TaxID=2819234 RepID=A0A939LRB2_9CELL|nr:hypothetical protein [Actinotalea soli]MBO1752639.1 hypothetical protein [Actinotalea soli]